MIEHAGFDKRVGRANASHDAASTLYIGSPCVCTRKLLSEICHLSSMCRGFSEAQRILLAT